MSRPKKGTPGGNRGGSNQRESFSDRKTIPGRTDEDPRASLGF